MQSTQKMGSEGTIRDLVFGELSVWKLLNPDSAALIHILGECSCCILVTVVMIFSLFSVKVVTVSNDNWIINTWSLWICLLHSRWMPWSLSWGQLLCLTQCFNSIPSGEAARGMQEKTTHFPLFFFPSFFQDQPSEDPFLLYKTTPKGFTWNWGFTGFKGWYAEFTEEKLSDVY